MDGAALSPGAVLAGRFRLARCVGRGGIGEVWLAHDTQLEDEPVACKFLKASLANDHAALSDFKREVLLTRRLRHPHILGVYTFWEDAGRPFITMEHVAGGNLREALIARGTAYPPETALPWMESVASALDYAHGQGVLHRDVKPGNILLAEGGSALLADFGIACAARERDCRAGERVTQGTVMYMSPDQLAGEPPAPADDRYGLAATAYELLAGRPPYVDAPLISEIHLHPLEPVAALSAQANAVLARALAKRAEDRFPDCRAFAAALGEAIARQGAARGPLGAVPHAGPGHTVVLPGMDRAVDCFRLGRVLCDMGVVSPSALDEALAAQTAEGGRLGDLLVALGHCGEEEVAEALCRQVRASRATLSTRSPEANALRLLTRDQCEARACLPLSAGPDSVVVAMADPLDCTTINELEATFGRRVAVTVATPTELRGAIETAYAPAATAPAD